MARFKVFIEYAGTKYSGWQIQNNARTIQGELTRVIAEVTGQRQFELYGSGRTDAGVHALEQVAHLDIITSIPAETRMGKGKGEVEYWAAVVKPGTVLFELGGVSEEVARATLARVSYKLPVHCRFVTRRPTI